jgi:hypothetical protein
MVRAVKTKTVRSLAKGQSAILLPGATTAEPWESWVFGAKEGEPELVQTCASPLENRLRKNCILALPVAQVFCLPLWLNETDPKQFAALIPLQIEMRGLQPRNGEAPVYDFTVVAQEAERTLVVVGLLPQSLPADLHAELYEQFDLSVRCLPLPPNALTLWSEHDRLNLALTRGSSLVYYQGLTDNAITTRVVQDLAAVMVTLNMQDIVPSVQRAVVWKQTSDEEQTALKSALKVPVHVEERPDPVLPSAPWKLTPSVVTEARRARENQRWLRRGLLIVLLLYLIFVGWLITNYVLTSLRVAELHKWQADNASQLALVEDGRAAWKELEPVVDEDSYPLQLLRHTQDSIPADQLHLTLFETNGQHILIKGEAKNVAGAFQFLSKLKADPFFSKYTFVMGNPRPLPNDLASFQIDATQGAAPASP